MQWTGGEQHTPLITVHGRDVTNTMAHRSTGRTSRPDKPVKDKACEHTDEHHQEELQLVAVNT